MITTSTGTPFTKSTDGGYTWTTVSAQPGSMRGCTFDLAGNIYISGNGGVFKSTNNGVSFNNMGLTTSGNQIISSGNRMYAAMTGSTTGGVWIYTDTTLSAINPSGSYTAGNYKLLQNYPNPFNPLTTIEFSVPESGVVVLSVYDISGKKINTLLNGRISAGTYSVKFDGSRLSSGIYLYELSAGNNVLTKKMILTK